MRKLVAIIVLVLVVVITYSVTGISLGGSDVDEYQLYTKGNSTGSGVWLYGDTFLSTCSGNDIVALMQNTVNLLAIQYTVSGDYDDMHRLMKRNNVAVISAETIGDSYIIYGLSGSTRSNNISVNGGEVNIQLAIRGNTITVGTPLIMGSY